MKAAFRTLCSVVGAIAVLAPAAVSAQVPVATPPPGMPPQIQAVTPGSAWIASLAAALNLNQGQANQMTTIVRLANYRLAATRAANGLTRAQKWARIQTIRRIERGQIENILSPAQVVRLRALESGM